MPTKLFDDFVTETKRLYRANKGKMMKFPSSALVPPYVQEIMRRCDDEAKFFAIRDDKDNLVKLAYCLHIRDRLGSLHS